jgi:DNA-binding transcriptional LysR family regulator
LNSELLQTFLKIVEYKQISQAAEAMYITQAAVSNRLNRLESQLGVKLINRLKGQATVTLTKYGEKLVPIAQQWVQLAREASNIKEYANYHSVSVLGAPDICVSILSLVCPLLLEDDPLLRYSIKNSNSNSNTYDAVNDGSINVGFTFSKSSRHQIDARQISEERLLLVTNLHSNYPDTVSADMLSRHDEVFIPYNQTYLNWHLMCWDSELQPFIQLDSSCLVNSYLLNPQNWALVPESMVRFMLKNHAPLRVLKLLEEPPALPIIAIRSKADTPNEQEIDRLILKVRSELFKTHKEKLVLPK